MKSFNSFILGGLAACLFFATNVGAETTQVIAGAGPSTAVVQLFVETFKDQPAAKGYTFKVPPKSAKHAGGIKGSDKFIFGRTGRPLNDKEKELGKAEIFLGRVPIAFAVGPEIKVKSITLSQLEGIFTGATANWKDLGGSDNPITTVGREPNEALFSVIKKEYPFFNNAQFNFVVKKDNHVINLLEKTQGKYAIGFGSKPNFQKASIATIHVEGFSTGVSLGLVYDLKNRDHALVKAVKAFASGKEWADVVKSINMLPPE